MGMQALENHIEFLKVRCASMPDKGTGNNARYTMADAGMAAFAVFFTQCPSFLANRCNSTIHNRNHKPFEPPQSAVIGKCRAAASRSLPNIRPANAVCNVILPILPCVFVLGLTR